MNKRDGYWKVQVNLRNDTVKLWKLRGKWKKELSNHNPEGKGGKHYEQIKDLARIREKIENYSQVWHGVEN